MLYLVLLLFYLTYICCRKKKVIMVLTQEIEMLLSFFFRNFFHILLRWQVVIGVTLLSHRPLTKITFIMTSLQHSTSNCEKLCVPKS